MRPRLTLVAVFWASALGLVVLLAALFVLVFRVSSETVEKAAARQREVALNRVAEEVDRYLGSTRATLGPLEERLRKGECRMAERRSVESCLLAALVADSKLDAITLTHATQTGFDDDGEAILAPKDRWQLQVYRESKGDDSRLCSRWVEQHVTTFEARTACRGPHEVLFDAKSVGEPESVDDPTAHFGFTTPASKAQHGIVLASDLAYAQRDEQLPALDRRIILTALQSFDGPDGHFAGVLKVGMVATALSERIRAVKVNPDDNEGFYTFITDAQGRLITGFSDQDVPVEVDDDLRVDAACAPPSVARALGAGLLDGITPDTDEVDGTVENGDEPLFVRFRRIPNTFWAAGVVGPKSYYFRELNAQRKRLLWATSAVLLLVLLGGALSLRAIRGSLKRFENETGRMSRFEFSPSRVDSPFADVRDALESLERAKTAVRAMGKYVPLGLVRQLLRDNVEPSPGGELRDVSLMFTDIEGFTTLVEKEPPAQLATWLGQYLSAMTAAIHATQGTVDKFIGDAVMALWNAPTADPQHVLNACRGALRCIADAETLFASPEWQGRAPLVTRFGLHVATVMVGHFGAPDRLAYTAIGDGVNLASRLEGLNKEYGTRVLASEAVFRQARGTFAFRRVDRVAVKGKAEAIEVYELLGELGKVAPSDAVKRYEAALDAYFRREFAAAATALGGVDDGPSRALAARCKTFCESPPPPEWDGVWILHTK